MTEMYLLFVAVAGLLFLAVVVFSIRQQKQGDTPRIDDSQLGANSAKHKNLDPLFDDVKGANQTAKPQEIDKTPEPTPKQESRAGGVSRLKNKIRPSFGSRKAKQTADKMGANSSVSGLNKDSTATNPETSATNKISEPTLSTKPSPSRSSEKSLVTDLIARFKLTNSKEQTELLSLFREHDFKFSRKIHLYGLNELTDIWCDVERELPTSRFVELGLSLQLADRNGCMSEKELHYFQQMVFAFSEAYDEPFDFSFSDLDEALQQARRLDSLGQKFDSMAVINVVPRGKSGFRIADLESCVRDLMMSQDANGGFVKSKGHKNNMKIQYRLAYTDGNGEFGQGGSATGVVHDLVLYMNVPATQEPELVFQTMVQDATNLATWLDGRVVDRAGKVMTQNSFASLSGKITEVVMAMQKEGITPGDQLTTKLF